MRKFLTIAAPLMLAIPAAHAQPPAHNGERMFAMMDTNGDGKLDKDEIAKMMQMRAERMGDPSMATPERVDALMKRLDPNGDGFVDKAEMEAMRKARAAAPPPEAPADSADQSESN